MLLGNASLCRSGQLCATTAFTRCRRSCFPAGRRAAQHTRSYTSTSTWKQDNPSFDDIELNEEYYRSLGISPEELADQLSFRASDTDPEGQDIGLEGPLNGESPSFLHDQDLESEAWGPEAVLLAGFKPEEYAIIRCTLDAAGASGVKVLPCTNDTLYQSVEVALQEPEVDWSQPRPDHWGLGRDWGSQRAILFSGLGTRVVLSVIELLEGAGLPPLCIAVVEEADAERVTGELLAEAVKAQRGGKTPKQHVWEVPDHVSRNLPDLEELIGQQAQERVQAMQRKQQEGPSQAQAEGSPDNMSPLVEQALAQEDVHQDVQATENNPQEHPSLLADIAEPSEQQLSTPPPAASLSNPSLRSAPRQAAISQEHQSLGAGQGNSSSQQQLSPHAQSMASGIEALRQRKQHPTQPAEASSSSLQQAQQAQQAKQQAQPASQIPFENGPHGPAQPAAGDTGLTEQPSSQPAIEAQPVHPELHQPPAAHPIPQEQALPAESDAAAAQRSLATEAVAPYPAATNSPAADMLQPDILAEADSAITDAAVQQQLETSAEASPASTDMAEEQQPDISAGAPPASTDTAEEQQLETSAEASPASTGTAEDLQQGGQAQQQVVGTGNLLDAIIAGHEPPADTLSVSWTQDAGSQQSGSTGRPKLGQTPEAGPMADNLSSAPQSAPVGPAADREGEHAAQNGGNGDKDSTLAQQRPGEAPSSPQIDANLLQSPSLSQSQSLSKLHADDVLAAKPRRTDAFGRQQATADNSSSSDAQSNAVAQAEEEEVLGRVRALPSMSASFPPADDVTKTDRSAQPSPHDRVVRSQGLKLGARARLPRHPAPQRKPSDGKAKPGQQTDSQLRQAARPHVMPRQTHQAITDQMTAEEFHRNEAPNADQRPAWATHVLTDVSPEHDMPVAAAEQERDTTAAATASRALTRVELRAIAERRGLDFERMLADARSKGIDVV